MGDADKCVHEGIAPAWMAGHDRPVRKRHDASEGRGDSEIAGRGVENDRNNRLLEEESYKMLTESHNEEAPRSRAKIMVVDDDPDLRQALSLRLRANQFETINVCDGYSAIAMAQKEKPHLIILDLGLPAGDGFAVLKNLQQYPALADIPVIVLTARDPEGNEKRTLESGATAFFQKPADNEELLGVIRACLQTGWGWGGAKPC